jgi:hypothetical protein
MMESKMGDMGDKQTTVASLLSASDLTYLADEESNVITQRTQKNQPFQKTDYIGGSGDAMVITWNTGNSFIGNSNSVLNFKLGLTGTGTSTFGGGNVLNIFQSINVIGRTGEVISNVKNANLYNYYMNKINHSFEWRNHQQGKYLLGGGTLGDDGTLTEQTITNGQEFSVPLRDLIPLFDDDVLFPNVVARGLRIEITLASVNSAFTNSTSGLTGYTVNSPNMLLDTYTLSAGAQNALNTMAAKDGLVLTFKDVNRSNSKKNASQSVVSNEIRQAVSMANSVIVAIRPSGNAQLATADSFATETLTATDSYKFRIGGVFLPQQPLVGSIQWYNEMSYAFDRLKYGRDLGIRQSEFQKNALAVAVLDRYWTAGSGMAINASTVLNFEAVIDSGVESSVDTFLCHSQRAVCFLQSIKILN